MAPVRVTCVKFAAGKAGGPVCVALTIRLIVLLLKPLGVMKGAEVREVVAVAFVVAEPAPEFSRLAVAVEDREPIVPVPHGEDAAELFQPVAVDASPEVITGVDPVYVILGAIVFAILVDVAFNPEDPWPGFSEPSDVVWVADPLLEV